MKKYKIGVIGVGMGVNMLPVNKTNLPFEVVAICGTTMSKMEAIQKQNPEVTLITTDYRDITGNPDIDIVGVFSPDALHFEHCKDALEHGKHIICTKPLVTSIEDAETLVKLVDEKKVKFLVGQTMRYEPQFAAVKRMYDDGELGAPLLAEAHYVHDMRPLYEMTPWRLHMPQDLMFGGACHPVDVLRWFFGDIESVHCVGGHGDIYESPEGVRYPLPNNFMMNLRFTNGVAARVLGAYGIVEPPMPMMGVTVFGTKGTAKGEFSDFLGGKVSAVFDKYEIKSPFEAIYPPEKQGSFGHGQTVLRYLEHFADCLENDKEPVPGIREGAKSIAACCAAYESLRTGEAVKVKNDF